MRYAAIACAGLLAFAAPAWADDAKDDAAAPSAESAPAGEASTAPDATKADDLGSFSIPAADGDKSVKDKTPADKKK